MKRDMGAKLLLSFSIVIANYANGDYFCTCFSKFKMKYVLKQELYLPALIPRTLVLRLVCYQLSSEPLTK